MMTTTQKLGATVAIALSLVTLSDQAFANMPAVTSEQRAACTSDVFRLCKAEIPNVTKIISCLKKEQSNLSPACQSVFAGK